MATPEGRIGAGDPGAVTMPTPAMIDLTDLPSLAPSAVGSPAHDGSDGVLRQRTSGMSTVPLMPTFPTVESIATEDVFNVPQGAAAKPLPEPGSAPVPVPARTASARRRDDWLVSYGVAPLLVAADLSAVGLGAVLTNLVADVPYTRTYFVFAAVLLAAFTIGHLYRSRLSMSVLDDLPRVAGRWLAALAITMLAQSAFARFAYNEMVVKWDVVTAAGFTLGFLVLLRAVAYAVIRRLRKERRVAHRTLVLGAGRVGAQVAEVLLDHPEYGLHPIGFLDSDPWLGPKELPLPILGGTDSLYHVLTDHGVNNVVVAFGSMRESALVDVIRTCDRLDTEIFLVPRLFELHHVAEDMDSVWGLPLVRLRRAARRSRGWRVKRGFDIVMSGIALVLLSPIMLVTALAVRLEGGPGIIFRQERVGVDGRRFQVMKFRSLKPVDETESQTNWNIKHDDRLGPVGKFLRKSSIDELPQLINILKGEMSIVGPRPERPHFVDQFCEAYPRYVARHRVPSGLTGWAQINGLRGDTSIADRARFDNYYIENWTLWLDIKIILRTVGSVVRGDGG